MTAEYVSLNTFDTYEQRLNRLRIFFGALKLSEIELGHLFSYQRSRSAGQGFTRIIGNRKGTEPVASPAGPNKINAELGMLRRMMLEAGAWTPELQRGYRPLRKRRSSIDPALSLSQQQHFLEVAASNPEWHVLYWYSLAAFDLTFSSDEMRTLRVGDVDLAHRIIGVNRNFGKNDYRIRTIPLSTAKVLFALERLLARARDLGATEPHHFLFPFRQVRNQYDPCQHMCRTALRKAFDEVRVAASVPWFRFNGMRHTAITRLSERGVPIGMIMERAGHITVKMSQHYTHISMEAQRRVMDRVAAGEFAFTPEELSGNWKMSA